MIHGRLIFPAAFTRRRELLLANNGGRCSSLQRLSGVKYLNRRTGHTLARPRSTPTYLPAPLARSLARSPVPACLPANHQAKYLRRLSLDRSYSLTIVNNRVTMFAIQKLPAYNSRPRAKKNAAETIMKSNACSFERRE